MKHSVQRRIDSTANIRVPSWTMRTIGRSPEHTGIIATTGTWLPKIFTGRKHGLASVTSE